ncbi:unnamed protein product (macronuclear) [Paramecium tetraurelia]|uniref:CS domain-containing protein n=1 Tax=Paramecium tetraurelia TaxID=5888 RepID=A0CDP2_PARTE|nr:uncharacterized protein GSPATT00007121001 [Paramecium tetraurelia]CAK68909.1 unnamed protein product [Paramecium tetraurelia]|eukprot:XP_001436306.1 hypothetical protein (macronuclear) [Paramecium tetraurelia strain d4-2]
MYSQNHSIFNSLMKQLEPYQFDEPTLPQWQLSSIKQPILSPYFENASEIQSSNFEFVKVQNGRASFKVTLPVKTSLKFELRPNLQVILGLGEGKLICKTEHSINEIPLKQPCNIMKPFELINQGNKDCKIGIQVS